MLSNVVSKRRLISTALAVALCAGAVSCDRGPKRALSLGLVQDKVYVLTTRSSGETTFTSPKGESFTLPVASDFTFVLHPGAPDELGNWPVSVQVTKSAFPSFLAPWGAIFHGYTFEMRLTPHGRINEFRLTDLVRGTIVNTVPAAASLDISAISDDALRTYMEPSIAIWPATPVAPGDSWVVDDLYETYPAPDTWESRKYTLESWDESGAVIRFTSTLRPAGKVAEPKYQIGGDVEGEVHVSPADGLIRSFEATYNLSGSIASAATGDVLNVAGSVRFQAELTPR